MTTVTKKVRIVELPLRRLACVKHTGPYKGDSALFGRLFIKVRDWAESKGLLGDPSTEAISVYHDDPDLVPEERQTISVGFTVPSGTPAEKDIHMLEIPKGKYIIGSFEILPTEYEQAWGEIMDFMKEEGIRPTGKMMYESYRNDPRSHPEGKHLVDICIKL